MHALLFANFAMHISLDAAEQAQIKEQMQFATVRKSSKLLEEGKICRNICFVNKGCLRIYYTDKNGQEHNILFCPENWWAVDIASFSKQLPAFYSISALEDTEAYYLSYQTLENLYITIPKLERFFRILTQNGFNLYQQRITSALSLPAEERYKRFQRLYPGLEQRITQKHIAAYLGITPAFLSMIRGGQYKG